MATFDFRGVDWYPWAVSSAAESWADNKLVWPPAAVCEHPMALLQVTDNMAFCDGCGRTFELKTFGGNL